MIAVIPARGGSKRIPNKNRKLFHGTPIIEKVVKNLINTDLFKLVIVSTDDSQISRIAEDSGAIVPFIRPTELSDDFVDTISVIKHALKELNILDDELVNCVYPTSIFLKKELISQVCDSVKNNPEKFSFIVNKFSHPVQRAFALDSKGSLSSFSSNDFSTRTQDLEPFFYDAGQIYSAFCRVWKKETQIIQKGSLGIYSPEDTYVDIDNPEDWDKAEFMYLYKSKSC
jgi:pseudaminic acid cytidylyltransferase